MMKNGLSILAAVFAAAGLVSAQQEAQHARALPYAGTWGVRILLPTAYHINEPVNAENFDIPAFMEQIDQLTTIHHVMINMGRGHRASWYASPYPDMAAVMGSDLFPERDLFGEVADALKARGLKVLVYFSVTGMDKQYLSKEQMQTWNAYLASEGLTHNEGVAQIMEYYSLKFGDKIDGWWVDRVTARIPDKDRERFATALRAGNPKAVIAMHTKVGAPVRQGTPLCDYAAGHPWTMKEQVPWDDGAGHENIELIRSIEAGPWVNQNGTPDNREGTALGHIFLPFQSQWKNGTAGFPTGQAIEWTSRVMDAGGMYTWAVARVDNGFAAPQFKQLLEINDAIARRENQ